MTGAEAHDPETIPQMIRAIVTRYGDAEAIVGGGRRLTFRELDAESARIATALLAMGIGKGSRIALLMPQGPDFAGLFMGIARIGAVAAPMSTLYQAPELAWVLANAEIDHLITLDRFLNHDYLARLEEALPGLADAGTDPLLLEAAPRLRSIHVVGEASRPWAHDAGRLREGSAAIGETMLRGVEDRVKPADPLCIIHTSGSTAEPKGVIHGHGPFVRHGARMARYTYPFGPGTRIAAVRQPFWIAGLVAVFSYTLHGGACLLPTTDGSPGALLRLIEEEGANAMMGDSGWFDAMRQSDELIGAGIDVVRLTMDSAAFARNGRYLSDQVERRAGPPRHTPDARFARSYGMTETLGAHTSLPFPELLPEDRPSWQGHANPGVDHKIVDPETREPLPRGEIGELLVRGYCLMLGLNGREHNDVFDAEGFYATGDLCTLDAEGYLKFEARRGDMLKVHGANVAPIEVELALTGLMGIEKAAVVGLPAAGHDTTLVAVVQMAAGRVLDEAAVIADLKRKLSSFKVPRQIIAMTEAEIPATGSGKVKKPELTALLMARLAPETAAA